jgi:hypothetical protein
VAALKGVTLPPDRPVEKPAHLVHGGGILTQQQVADQFFIRSARHRQTTLLLDAEFPHKSFRLRTSVGRLAETHGLGVAKDLLQIVQVARRKRAHGGARRFQVHIPSSFVCKSVRDPRPALLYKDTIAGAELHPVHKFAKHSSNCVRVKNKWRRNVDIFSDFLLHIGAYRCKIEDTQQRCCARCRGIVPFPPAGLALRLC